MIGISYQRKYYRMEIQISRELKDKSHVYNTMKAKVAFLTSYRVATGLF